MNSSKFKAVSSLCFCIFLLYFVINNFSQTHIQNRTLSSEDESLAKEMPDSEFNTVLKHFNDPKDLIPVPVIRNKKLTGEFKMIPWNKATMKQVQSAYRQNVNIGTTLVSQARTFPSTHVAFALAIHLVTAIQCGGFNPFNIPIYKPHNPSSPSCGEDTLIGLLTDPLGIAGFYAFMVASAQTSGRLNNFHIKQIERLGLKNGLNLDERKIRVRKYIQNTGLSAKMMYGYLGMAVGSMTQDLLIDFIVQSKPCLNRFKLGLGLESTECKSFKNYMLSDEKWLEFLGATGNMLSAAFAAFLAQTTMSKIFGPVLGKTIRLVGSKAFLLGFTFVPGGALKAVFSFGKSVKQTFSHAVYFVAFEEFFRNKIMTPWYDIVHNKIYARKKIKTLLTTIKNHEKSFWNSLQDESLKSDFISTLRNLDSQLKESQAKSHLRPLNEENTPMFHRKAAHLYAAYEGTSKLYSYVNRARSKGYTKPLEIDYNKLKTLKKILNKSIANKEALIKNQKFLSSRTYHIQEEKVKKIKVWINRFNLLFNDNQKSFDIKGYFNLRKDFRKSFLKYNSISDPRGITQNLNRYWYEIDSFIEANITSKDILSKFYANKSEAASFYEALNQISYSDNQGEKFFKEKLNSNTVFDWVVLKSICGDQNFSIKDEKTYSIEFIPAGIIDRTKVDFNCKNPKNIFPLFQNKYKSDYFVDMEKIEQLRADFKSKIPTTHKDYTTLLEMINDIKESAQFLNDRAVVSAHSVSLGQVIKYTSKLKKLHKFINQKTTKENTITKKGYRFKNLDPSIKESMHFTFEVRDLITESVENKSENHAVSKHTLYSIYSKDNTPLIENEYSGLHFLLNPKVPLKSFVKHDLNIWWLKNVQKKAMQSHLNLIVEYKEMIEKEILNHNAVHLNAYIEADELEYAISKAAQELLLKTSELKFKPVQKIKNNHFNLQTRGTQFKRYSNDLTSKSYDIQTLTRSRFYLDLIRNIFFSFHKINEEVVLEKELDEQIKITLKTLSELLVQLSYNPGEIKESKAFVEDIITRLNTAIIKNHKQFSFPNSHDSFINYSDKDFNKANKDLIGRLFKIFEFEAGKPGAFILMDASGDGAQIRRYRDAIQRSIRDHYSLYIQNTVLIDDKKKVQFKKTLLATLKEIDSIEAIIKKSSIKNTDVLSELIDLLRLGVHDINDFYNKYIEAFELLPQAGLADISNL